MGEAKTEARDDEEKTKAVILRALESRGKKARFITELSAAVARSAVAADKLERTLAALESEGLVMIRDHYCADPHLAGVDLRIAALVQRSDPERGHLDAIRSIDEAWDKWLAEYLANHRCE